MHDLHIQFTDGPMTGEHGQYELGSLVIGREPRPEPGQLMIVLRGADPAVSRNHAIVLDVDGEVVLRNLSGNGTRVEGKVVMEEAVLQPGNSITVGQNHSFTVSWQVVGQRQAAKQKLSAGDSAAEVASSGLLGSPIVRSLLAIYLLGIIGVAAWFGLRGDGGQLHLEHSQLGDFLQHNAVSK